MITQEGMQKASSAIYKLMKGIRVITEDGTKKDLPIYEGEADEAHLKIMGLIDDTVAGKISHVQLIDTDNEVFAENNGTIEKSESEGLLVSFMIRLYETGGIA